jgi:catechol 2,3-dioxygenase-like lactoylglutathione lyase family enzyme
MTVQITKDSIDLGIVVRDGDAALRFYRDTLGFEHTATTPMGGGKMHRLMCGTSMIKLVVLDQTPEAAPAPGGIPGATGYRYWTVSVSNLQEVAERCAAAGYRVAVQPREIRPGVSIAMVEDPEGNWVEFLQQS